MQTQSYYPNDQGNFVQSTFQQSQPNNTYTQSVYHPSNPIPNDQIKQDARKYQKQYGNNNQDWQEVFDPASVFDSDDEEMSLDEVDNNMKRVKKNYKQEYYDEKRKHAPIPQQKSQQQQQQSQQFGNQSQSLQAQQQSQQYFNNNNQQQSTQYQNTEMVRQSEYSSQQPNLQNYARNSSYNQHGQQQQGIDFNLELQSSDNELYGFRNINLPEINQPNIIPLLAYSQDNQNPRFEFNLKAKELFERYKGKYQIITIFGKRQSRKHDFLNEIIQDRNQFQQNQEGLQLFTKPLVNEEEGIYTFFVQCSDLPDDPNANPKMYDGLRRYISFAVMISSQIMFISESGLNTQTLNDMIFLTNICNIIHVEGGENQSVKQNTYWENEVAISQYLPGLLVVFKDFPLQNNSVDLSQEFESILAQYQREHKIDVTKAFIKKFSDREAYGISKQDSNNHGKELFDIVDKIKNKVTYKQFHGQTLNGRMISNLMAYSSIQLNSKNCRLSYDQAWNYVVKNECIFAYNKCLQTFHGELKNYFSQDEARKFEDLYKILKYIRETTVYEFHYIAGIREKNEFFSRYKMDMMQKIDQVEQEIFNKNDELAVIKNKEILGKLVQPIKQKLSPESSQGYSFQQLDKFFLDFERFLDSYDHQSVGTNKAECFIEFMMEFHPQLIDKMVSQIQQKYKQQEDVEQDKTEEELQQVEQEIPLLEQKIEQYEQQCLELEQQQVQLLSEKDNLQETVSKFKKENQQKEQMDQKIQDLKQQKQQQQQEIQNLEKQLNAMEKPKKGCCGCFG